MTWKQSAHTNTVFETAIFHVEQRLFLDFTQSCVVWNIDCDDGCLDSSPCYLYVVLHSSSLHVKRHNRMPVVEHNRERVSFVLFFSKLQSDLIRLVIFDVNPHRCSLDCLPCQPDSYGSHSGSFAIFAKWLFSSSISQLTEFPTSQDISRISASVMSTGTKKVTTLETCALAVCTTVTSF